MEQADGFVPRGICQRGHGESWRGFGQGKRLTDGRRMARLPIALSGNNSAVECNLAKVEVAGSNPVSRSILLQF